MKKPLLALIAALSVAASRVVAGNPADAEKSSAKAAQSFNMLVQSAARVAPPPPIIPPHPVVPPHPIVPPHPAPAPHPAPHPTPAPQPHPEPHPIVPPHPWPWPPFFPPHNDCRESGQSCSAGSECCSGQCGSGLCQ